METFIILVVGLALWFMHWGHEKPTVPEQEEGPCEACPRWYECNGVDKNNCPHWKR